MEIIIFFFHHIMSSRLKYKYRLPDRPMYKILDNLYIGGIDASGNESFLRNHNITHVINCASEHKINHPTICVYNYDIHDTSEFPIHSFFVQSCNIIMHILNSNKQHKVLVSCHMGMNRSMTIMVYFLHKFYGWSIDKIIDFVISRRPYAMLTNDSFYRQLKVCEFKKIN